MGLRNAYLTLLEAILSSFKEVNFPTFNILLSFLTWKLKVASFFFSYSIYTLHWHCKNETKGAMTSFAFHTGPFLPEVGGDCSIYETKIGIILLTYLC